jgi:hypothetical protein
MATADKLSAEQAKELADELSVLSKQQSQALQTAAYIRMSQEEARTYDERSRRIGEIWGLLHPAVRFPITGFLLPY